MLIRTCITDGNFFYNLYDGNTQIAQNLSGTSHAINNLGNNVAHRYTLKTIVGNGETEASNMAGITLGTASLASLEMAANDKMTVTENSKLTVSGTLSNSNPANLILEDDAQLVHGTTGVKATVKKSITPYTQGHDDGWYFIASPVTESITPSTANGLLANSYDLYLFDQSEGLEWRNFEDDSHPFSTLNHKTGYLYANNGNTTLSFEGTLAVTAEPTPLAYDENAAFKGFNLIGNPYPCNAQINSDFYEISGNSIAMLASNAREIVPCEGIFVKATGTGQSATFTKAGSAKGTNSTNCLDIVAMQDKAVIERARVRFGEGIGMEKFSLNTNSTRLSLGQGGQEYAVAYADGQNEMPLNFKAAKNGTYTLSIEANSTELDYLHLIDNLTGTDTDLLATPSYTFEATTTDYASRFRFVFSTDDASTGSASEAPFAYVSNGEIILTNVGDAGTASLLVIDMMGRVLVSSDALNASLVSLAGIPAGVYVLHLVQGDNVRTQKIVIE